MTLLFPLLFGMLGTRAGAAFATRRGAAWAQPWASWAAASGAAMAAVFASTAVAHFKEPQRSGLIAIVPEWVPLPAVVVTATGLLELCLAVGLVLPRSRRIAAFGAIVLLVAMFPANVIAAQGVDDPAAPDTALLPRTLLQLVFIAVCVIATFRTPGDPQPSVR